MTICSLNKKLTINVKRYLGMICAIGALTSANSYALSSEQFDLPSCYSSAEVLSDAITNYSQNDRLVIKINTLLNKTVIACESGQFELGYQHLINASELYDQLKQQ